MMTQLQSPNLGRFLPARWTLPQNPLGLAPAGLCNLGDGCGLGGGLGAIISGGIYHMYDNGVVAEILARKAAAEALLKNPLGPVGLSCGSDPCSPSAHPCQVGLCGTGLNGVLEDVMAQVTGAASNWKTWAMVGAGVVALVMFTGGGGSQRSAELASARATYKAKVAKIKASRPRRYQKYV